MGGLYKVLRPALSNLSSCKTVSSRSGILIVSSKWGVWLSATLHSWSQPLPFLLSPLLFILLWNPSHTDINKLLHLLLQILTQQIHNLYQRQLGPCRNWGASSPSWVCSELGTCPRNASLLSYHLFSQSQDGGKHCFLPSDPSKWMESHTLFLSPAYPTVSEIQAENLLQMSVTLESALDCLITGILIPTVESAGKNQKAESENLITWHKQVSAVSLMRPRRFTLRQGSNSRDYVTR